MYELSHLNDLSKLVLFSSGRMKNNNEYVCISMPYKLVILYCNNLNQMFINQYLIIITDVEPNTSIISKYL